MRNCPRCGKENEADARFCGRCGLDLHEYDAARARPLAEEAQKPCYRHPKVLTGLSCGRCERSVCLKCAVNGPAGVRCRDCARHNVAVRPGAVLHSAKTSVRSLGRVGPWGIYALLAIGSLVFGAFRSCNRPPQGRPAPPPVEIPAESPAPR